MNKYRLGNEICRLREEKGLTQSELAKIIDVSDKAISKWENGQSIPRMDTFESLAGALDTTVEHFIAASKDDTSLVYVENNYATTLHLYIDDKPVSIGDNGQWIEVNPSGFTMTVKGEYDFSFFDDISKEESSIKNKLILKAGKKLADNMENMMLITDCTYSFSDVPDGEKMDIVLDSITDETGLAVLRNFMITYPKIEMENGTVNLEKAHARNKKQYVRSFRRETVWSDFGFGLIWMILEAPIVHYYIKRLCSDSALKKRIINGNVKRKKHTFLEFLGIALLLLILLFIDIMLTPDDGEAAVLFFTH